MLRAQIYEILLVYECMLETEKYETILIKRRVRAICHKFGVHFRSMSNNFVEASVKA